MSDWAVVAGAVAGFGAALGGEWLKGRSERKAAAETRDGERVERRADAQRELLLRAQKLLEQLRAFAVASALGTSTYRDEQEADRSRRDDLLYELAGLRNRISDDGVRKLLNDFQDSATMLRDDVEEPHEVKATRAKALRDNALAATAAIGDALRKLDEPKGR